MARVKYKDLVASLESAAVDGTAAVPQELVTANPEGAPTKVTGITSKDSTLGTEQAPKDPVADVNDGHPKEDSVDQTSNDGKSGTAADEVAVKEGNAFDPARPAQENIVENEGLAGAPIEEADGLDIAAATSDIIEGDSGDDILIEADEVADDLERFESVACALEAYTKMLNAGIRQRGYVSSETAAAIQIGLEAMSPELFGKVVPGLEAFRNPIDRITVSNELASNLAEGAKNLRKHAVEAFKQLIQLIIDAWNSFSQDAGKLKERLANITSQAKNLKTSNGDKITIKGAARLTIDGQFAVSDLKGLQALKAVSTELLIDWPTHLTGVLKKAFFEGGGLDMIQTFQNLGKIADQEAKVTFKTAKPINDSEYPESFSAFDLVYRSPKVPGDYALYVGVNSEVEETSPSRMAANALKVEFKRVDGASAASQGDLVVDVPSQFEIVAMAKMLTDILTDVAENVKLRQATESLSGIMKNVGAVSKFVGKVAETINGESGESKDLIDGGQIVGTVATRALEGNRMLLGYMFSTVKAHIAVLETFVKHHETPEEA